MRVSYANAKGVLNAISSTPQAKMGLLSCGDTSARVVGLRQLLSSNSR
jgi:hypothetical protein